MESDFSMLSKEGIAAAKKAEEKEKVETRAHASATHSIKRKEFMPPTRAELKAAEKLKIETKKEDSAFYDKREIGKLKSTTGRYVNHFAEKYPEIKKLAKPKETDGLDEWRTYLRDMQDIIGGAKAGERFDTYLGVFAQGVMQLNTQFPEAFAGYNLVSPVPLSSVVTSPKFLADIEDEKMEIIFTHSSWFASSYWTRLLSALGKATVAVAMQNRQMNMDTVLTPEALAALKARTEAARKSEADRVAEEPISLRK